MVRNGNGICLSRWIMTSDNFNVHKSRYVVASVTLLDRQLSADLRSPARRNHSALGVL